MVKTIQIGDQEVTFSTSFAWVFVYRNQFGKDPAQVLLPAISEAQGLDGDAAALAMMSTLGFTGTVEICWSMVRLIDKTIPEPDRWVESFGDDFSLIELFSEAIPDVIESCFATKKSQAPTATTGPKKTTKSK